MKPRNHWLMLLWRFTIIAILGLGIPAAYWVLMTFTHIFDPMIDGIRLAHLPTFLYWSVVPWLSIAVAVAVARSRTFRLAWPIVALVCLLGNQLAFDYYVLWSNSNFEINGITGIADAASIMQGTYLLDVIPAVIVEFLSIGLILWQRKRDVDGGPEEMPAV